MRRADNRVRRFVRALLAGGVGTLSQNDLVAAQSDGRRVTLPLAETKALLSSGVLSGTPGSCRAGQEARLWLRRQMLPPDELAGQHREPVLRQGRVVNLDESPLLRLAVPAKGEETSFLAPHQVEAGERIRRLAERAQMQPRVTPSYDPGRIAQAGNGGASEITDMAADARCKLNRMLAALPPDCAGVVADVCAFGKGLQEIEAERRWPRRSAKLVLRIGLEQAASHWGLRGVAVGQAGERSRVWREAGARPTEFG